MKKTILLGVVLALGATTMVSCKKDYNCKCDKTRTGNSGSITTNDGIYTFKDTRLKAEAKCNDLEETGSDILGAYTKNCEIQ